MEEMESGLESTESDASEGSSSEASGSESSNGAQAQAPASEQKQETAPFHEHPRFKELVEQKNEAQRQYQEMISQYKTMQSQLNSLQQSQPKAPTESDQLIEDLKKIDPRLANVIQSQLKAMETNKTVQERLEQFENQSRENARQQTLNTAVAKINSLHESGKMSDFGKSFINNQLDIAYRNGKLDASNLPAVEAAYSEASKAIKAYEESLRRDVTKSYVQGKTKDAAVPASVPKGAQAKPAQKALNVPKDKEALKAAIVKSFMKEQASSQDAVNS